MAQEGAGGKRCLRRCLLQDPHKQYDTPGDAATGQRPGARRAPTFLFGFAAGAVAAVGVLYGRLPPGHPAALDLAAEPDINPLRFSPTRAEEVLGELSSNEVSAVAHWFTARTGVVGMQNSSPNCAWLSGPSAVELMRPPKAATLAYIDGDGPRPQRFARVTVVDGTQVQEYRVGPLEDGKPAADAQYEALFEQGQLPRAKRPTEPHKETVFITPLVEAAINDAAEPLVKAFGPIFQMVEGYDASTGSLDWYIRNDALTPAGVRQDLIVFLWTPPAPEPSEKFWMHPMPMTMRVNTTEPDPAKWQVTYIHFCGQGPWTSGKAFGEAYSRGEVRICPFPKSTGDWDYPTRQTKPSPVGLHPRESHGGVSWGPWSFTVTQRPSTGLAIMDVRFRGERVVYEMALQDAYAGYGGDRTNQFFYSDASWSLSQLSADLRPGVDCPEGAHFLSAPNWYRIVTGGDANADPLNPREGFWPVCIFEWSEDNTVWRHMDNTEPPRVHGLTRRTIVVRSVFTVANYDYITDVRFREDGEIEAKTSFAGYIEARYFHEHFNPQERNFSTVIRPGLAGPVHSHTICWKVDVDIAGERHNAFKVTKVKAGPVNNGAEMLDGQPLLSKYLEHSFVEREGVGRSTFVADPHSPAVWSIVDRAATSSVGNPRGYAISLASFSTVQVLPDGHRFTRAMPFTKYHLAITKYRDEEYRATSPYVQYDVAEASGSGQDLDRFLSDEESLLDEDLVAWVTLGKEHVVRQEDMPLVSNFGVGFQIIPWNFLSQNAAASGPQ